MLVEIPLTAAARAAVEDGQHAVTHLLAVLTRTRRRCALGARPAARVFSHAGCRAHVDATGLCPACRTVPAPGELVVRPRPGPGTDTEEVGGTRVRGHLDLGPEHHTPWGVVHGGVYTTAVESAASIGATAAVADRGQYAVGLHNATDFLRASATGRADVLAEPLHQGRSQQLWLVTITNQQGKHLARGQLRLQNVSRKDAPQ